MKISTFFVRFFTWWNGQTLGTQLWTRRYGELVGEDEFGNRYYRTKGGKIDPTLGFERRWVIYNGYAEASMVGPAWHGWLHHTFELPPTEEKVVPRPWWKPHRPNLTGTPAAHPDRLDARPRPPPQGDRRLQGVDAGQVAGGRTLGDWDQGQGSGASIARPSVAVFPLLNGSA